MTEVREAGRDPLTATDGATTTAGRLAVSGEDLRCRLLATQPGRQRRKLMTKFLVDQVALASGVAAAELDEHRPFVELGLSSQSIVELGQRLQAATGTELSSTVGGSIRRSQR